MILSILSTEKVIFDGEVELVELPGVCGRFEVLKDHAPLLSVLESGEVRYRTGGREAKVEISGGIAEIRDNRISVCIN